MPTVVSGSNFVPVPTHHVPEITVMYRSLGWKCGRLMLPACHLVNSTYRPGLSGSPARIAVADFPLSVHLMSFGRVIWIAFGSSPAANIVAAARNKRTRLIIFIPYSRLLRNVLRNFARKAGSVVGAARTLIRRDLRIRAERTRHIHVSAGHMRSQNLIGGAVRFTPAFHHTHFIELVGPDAALAVIHAG